jgi:hypothetical protein
MPRFVLLYHECPPGYERPSHWDLMLEAGDWLRTWALAELPRAWQAAHAKTCALRPDCPALSSNATVEAQVLGKHRRAYLTFEGPLSGNRGAVTQIDAGSYTIVGAAPTELQIELAAEHVSGRVSLRESDRDRGVWILSCEV